MPCSSNNPLSNVRHWNHNEQLFDSRQFIHQCSSKLFAHFFANIRSLSKSFFAIIVNIIAQRVIRITFAFPEKKNLKNILIISKIKKIWKFFEILLEQQFYKMWRLHSCILYDSVHKIASLLRYTCILRNNNALIFCEYVEIVTVCLRFYDTWWYKDHVTSLEVMWWFDLE